MPDYIRYANEAQLEPIVGPGSPAAENQGPDFNGNSTFLQLISLFFFLIQLEFDFDFF